jgi:hypothetical protein
MDRISSSRSLRATRWTIIGAELPGVLGEFDGAVPRVRERSGAATQLAVGQSSSPALRASSAPCGRGPRRRSPRSSCSTASRTMSRNDARGSVGGRARACDAVGDVSHLPRPAVLVIRSSDGPVAPTSPVWSGSPQLGGRTMVASTIVPKEDAMHSVALLDRAGRRRSPATTSSLHQGVSPGNKVLRYPPDPPTIGEIVAVMRAAGDGPEGVRLRDVIVVTLRAGVTDQRSAWIQRDGPRCRAGCFARAPWQGRQAPRGGGGPLGVVTARTMARAACWSAGRTAVLRRARTDAGPAVRGRRGPPAAARRCARGRRASAVRAASAAPRACG